MKELIIAFGLFLFIEGILYALFPSKMRSMIRKLELVKDNQLRIGGLIFAIIGFVIIYYIKNWYEKVKDIFFCNSIFFKFTNILDFPKCPRVLCRLSWKIDAFSSKYFYNPNGSN